MENRSINAAQSFTNLNQAITENKGSSYVMDARNNLPANVFRGGLFEYSVKYKNLKNIDTIMLTGEQVKPGIFDSSIKWNEKHFSDFMKIINETKIKRLSLQGCTLNPEIGVVIGDALKTNTSLEELAVTSNELGGKGLIAILNGLKQNSTLKILNSRSYNVSCYYWSTEELISLKELIIANKTLKKIELPDNQISKPHHIRLLSIAYQSSNKELATITGFELSRSLNIPAFNRDNALNGELEACANVKFRYHHEL